MARNRTRPGSAWWYSHFLLIAIDPSMSDYPPVVMTIAGSDPTGGAGLQADLLTLASMGCHPVSVVTAVTVQDSIGVHEVYALDREWVIDQARCVLQDMPVAAFKIGLLGSTEIVTAIAELLSDYPDLPLVFDPVLASGRGDEFANDEMIAAINDLIVPQSTLITPNSPEARRLAEQDDDEDDELSLEVCSQRLLKSGCEYVLITGTHENTPLVVNRLFGRNGLLRSDEWQRLPGSFHGSGCTLASTAAALIARGLDLEAAVREAQEYTWQTLNASFRLGMGQKIPDRLFWAREEDDEIED